MKHQKVVALVAHDNRKRDLIEWVAWNHAILAEHQLVCTGTTHVIHWTEGGRGLGSSPAGRPPCRG